MYTGIIRETGRITERRAIEGGEELVVEAPLTSREAGHGDSIAVDGCCLTVTRIEGTRLAFELSPETLVRTVAGDYQPGARVNLEDSLAMSEKLGGHFVTGHVDTVGQVVTLDRSGAFAILRVKLDASCAGLVAEKGSISVNGVSLTVAAWNRPIWTFDVALIPTTLDLTNIGDLAAGGRVNIEYDLIARYLKEMRACADASLSAGAPVSGGATV